MTKMQPAKLKLLMKRFKCKALPNGNILTGPVRLSYARVVKPGKNDDGNDVYSSKLLFPLGADLSALEEAATGLALETHGPKWRAKRLAMPLRDQGADTWIDEAGDEHLKQGNVDGAMFANANTYRAPGVVHSDGKTPITDEDTIYSGCWAVCSVRPGAYEHNGNVGIKLWLQNVMFLADDEVLGGGSGGAKAEQDFEGLEGVDDIDAMFGDDDAEEAAAETADEWA